MMLNHSPRGSFSVPVNITLQGARRRHMRDVFHQQGQLHETGGNWRKDRELKCNEKARAQIPESSVGEDRAILLGFTMMTFSILMYFLVGIVMVKPCLHSDWNNFANCSLVQIDLLDEVMDCRGIVSFKCLRVLVNISSPEKTLRLYYDEDFVKSRPKGIMEKNKGVCFYIPKCQQNKTEQETEASNIKHELSAQGENMTCYLSATYPDDAILRRKYTIRMAFYYLLWPSLVLFGGILLVGLVKLNQHLASLCTEISREELLGKQSKLTEGRIYRFLRCRPGGNMEQHDQVS
ncbi:LOW QUALITY PROTEIN: calcium-activated potassium channel subunit beta-3 [Megalobrama amblycephala]|uniref:LOW QUALITY PROTEIN: calcium-activated potassium channel subunit beta-3 n=1 Tax=Megalobrama amblycephala TaxID=75352 RepID=UPI0020144352|nr:LOW QUALITY PROTEIN: calcium-activated potassium channel subunit beta-3 [Megalobrama amblycephala]